MVWEMLLIWEDGAMLLSKPRKRAGMKEMSWKKHNTPSSDPGER